MDSAQYDTAQSQFFSILNCEYLGENETKFENMLTRWSVAQTSSNDEKNWGSKILLDCPFKRTASRSVFDLMFFQPSILIGPWSPLKNLAVSNSPRYE